MKLVQTRERFAQVTPGVSICAETTIFERVHRMLEKRNPHPVFIRSQTSELARFALRGLHESTSKRIHAWSNCVQAAGSSSGSSDLPVRMNASIISGVMSVS